jgi:broad specificity phosphatase PhoE
MAKLFFITHPEVVINPEVPVPLWDLSEVGRRRLRSLLRKPWINNIGFIYSSEETKASSAGEAIARHVSSPHVTLAALGEVDRSSTGYLEMDEHDHAVAELFRNPEVSYQGWERAIDAQDRIVSFVKLIDAEVEKGASIAIVSHGGVGTLLMCHIKCVHISRDEAGPGQGNYFCFERGSWDLVYGWRPIDHD